MLRHENNTWLTLYLLNISMLPLLHCHSELTSFRATALDFPGLRVFFNLWCNGVLREAKRQYCWALFFCIGNLEVLNTLHFYVLCFFMCHH